MRIFIFAIIILSLVATIINKVFGVDIEVSVWISLAMMAGAIIAFICWLFLSHKAKVIERAQNIAKLREQRLWKQYNHDWLRRNKKFVKQRNREIDREVDERYEREYQDRIKTVSCYYSFSESRYIREVDRYGSPYVNSDDELVVPIRGPRY